MAFDHFNLYVEYLELGGNNVLNLPDYHPKHSEVSSRMDIYIFGGEHDTTSEA